MLRITELLRRARGEDHWSSRALIILGMHRSGTSFLTGSLQLAGLQLGNHSQWNPFNVKGNRENPDIVEFHERMLADRGLAWDRPPPGAVRWTREERQRARRLIEGFVDAAHWGFKDPRALLFVEGWCRVLPQARFIGIFRHPTPVARSLEARGGMPEAQAFDLWIRYNRRLLALHDRHPFPLLCFDEGEEQLHRRLDGVLPAIGLAAIAEERFFAAELRHHETPHAELPATLQSTYHALRSRAL